MSNVPDHPLRVLLVAINGAGAHYGGPGSAHYRMFSTAAPGRFSLTLLHAFEEQPQLQLFERQVWVPRDGGWRGQMRFMRQARQFVARAAEGKEGPPPHITLGVQAFHHNVLPAWEGQKRGVPGIVKPALHGNDLADKGGWRALLGVTRRRRALVRRLAGVICISRAIEQEMLNYDIPANKVAYIPNGVDASHFRPAVDNAEKRRMREQLGLRDMPTIVFCGSVIPRKQPHALVESLGVLKRAGVDAQLLVAGPEQQPEYSRHMRNRATELGVSEQIVWAGFAENVAPHFRAADVFALPSVNEGLPGALLEALSSGLPVVVTPISGHMDWVEPGRTGTLASAEPQPLADALRPYLTQPHVAQQQGAAARQLVEHELDWRVILDRHEALFRRVMRGEPAAG